MKRSFEHRVSKSGWVTVPFFRVGYAETRLGPIVAACTPNKRVRIKNDVSKETRRPSGRQMGDSRRQVFA